LTIIPLFQHSIIPCEWRKLAATKSFLLSIGCRNSETLIMKNQTMPKALKLFSQTVRELRKNLNLTQEQLGELCERHPVFISELERGIKNPSLDSILRLCRGLKIEPGDLMNLAFQPDLDNQTIKKQIMMLINQQSTEDLKKLLLIIKAYLETE